MKRREKNLAEIIKEKALSLSYSSLFNEEIDEKGIGFSNNKVFLEACNSLRVKA